MDYDRIATRADALLKRAGVQVTLVDELGTEHKAYGAFVSTTTNDWAKGAAKLTTNNKQLFMSATVKKAPEVGHHVKLDSDEWVIVEVETFQPARTVLAYRVVMQ